MSLASGIISDFKSIQPPKKLDLLIKHIVYPNSANFVFLSMVHNGHPSPWNVIVLKNSPYDNHVYLVARSRVRRFTQMDPNEPKWTQMAIKVENNYNKILITNIITCFSHFMGLLAVIKKNKDPNGDPNGDSSGKQL